MAAGGELAGPPIAITRGARSRGVIVRTGRNRSSKVALGRPVDKGGRGARYFFVGLREGKPYITISAIRIEIDTG